MKVVSRFENRLLRLLACFLRRLPLDAVRAEAEQEFDQARPHALGPVAVALVREALAKGCTAVLAGAGVARAEGAVRGDGWRRERFLRDNRPVDGRLWERTPPERLGLTFSRHTLG